MWLWLLPVSVWRIDKKISQNTDKLGQRWYFCATVGWNRTERNLSLRFSAYGYMLKVRFWIFWNSRCRDFVRWFHYRSFLHLQFFEEAMQIRRSFLKVLSVTVVFYYPFAMSVELVGDKWFVYQMMMMISLSFRDKTDKYTSFSF